MIAGGMYGMLNDVHDLVSVAEDMKLPHTLEEVIPRKAYMVPMNMELLSRVQAVCFTGRTQIKWLLQLAETDFKYTMHIDGVHKLHHGDSGFSSPLDHMLSTGQMTEPYAKRI